MKQTTILFSFLFSISAFALGGNQKIQKHKVSDGENIYRISLKYNTSIGNLLTLNPGLKEDKVIAGQVINVPLEESNIGVDATKPTENFFEQAKYTIANYRVMDGETWKDVANMYQTTVATLLSLNSNMNSEITAGEIIKVPNTISKSAAESAIKISKKLDKINAEEVKYLSYKSDVVVFKSAEDRRAELKSMMQNDPNFTVINGENLASNNYVDDRISNQNSLNSIYQQMQQNRAVEVVLQLKLKNGTTVSIKDAEEQRRILTQMMNSRN